MGKKISIRIKDVENLEFEILENAQSGDFFSLKQINEIDFSNLEKQIQNMQNNFFKQKLEEEKRNWLNEFIVSDQYKSLENDLIKAKNEIEKMKYGFEKEKELAISKTKNENKEQIHQLENKISTFEKDKENEILKIKNEKDKIIHELNEKILKADLEKENSLQKKENEWELKYQNKINQLENENKEKIINLENEHKIKIDEIERNKSSNAKVIGEELENWIQNEYNQTFGLIDGCKLEKANQVIGGHKPDFIFSVFDSSNQTLGKITIEAKTQKSHTETNKKNKDYFEKLEMDRKNNSSEFALLISELEPNETFYIKKAPDEKYQNMFITRPQYFITFLSIVRYIWIKKSDILREKINFKEKEKILNDFELLKNEILSNSLRHTEDGIRDITKLSENIEKDALKIRNKAETIVQKHLNTIRNKIENFKIKKTVKDTEKFQN